jgi:hypothetical protein
LEAETGKRKIHIGGGVFQHLTVRGEEFLLFGGDGAGVDQDETSVVFGTINPHYRLNVVRTQFCPWNHGRKIV